MLTAKHHYHFYKLWDRLARSLALRCANALYLGCDDDARILARRVRAAWERCDGAWFCATSELADDFREGPPC